MKRFIVANGTTIKKLSTLSNSDFYIKYNFLPTKTQIDLGDNTDYNFYKDQRLFLLENLLNIPRKILDGCSYLEIGSDSGENALFAATLGANVTCIDPNPLAIKSVNRLFDDFPNKNIAERLIESKICYFEEYQTDKNFNLIACEGMIHTVPDSQNFYKKISDCIGQQGFVLISFCNELSIFADLFHSKVFKSLVMNHLKVKEMRRDNIGEIINFGKSLFSNKWSKINHLRSIDTWLMDVLLNPAVKIESTVNTLSMLKTFKDFGLNYWSSWPRYEQIGEMRWHRNIKLVDEGFADISNQYKKLSLQFLLGNSTDFIHVINDQDFIEDLYLLCCKINDELDNSNWVALGHHIKTLIEILTNDSRFIHTNDYGRILSILRMITNIVDYLGLEMYQDLINHIKLSSCLNESSFDFSNYWGQPNHYLVLYKN